MWLLEWVLKVLRLLCVEFVITPKVRLGLNGCHTGSVSNCWPRTRLCEVLGGWSANRKLGCFAHDRRYISITLKIPNRHQFVPARN
jgi:hypothetical protein